MDQRVPGIEEQVRTELRRLSITPSAEAAGTLEFAIAGSEYLALLRTLPDGAGWDAVEVALRALLPPEFKGAWDRKDGTDQRGA